LAMPRPPKRKSGNNGASGAKKRNKKGNPKRTAALKSIRTLIDGLPNGIKREWLSAEEILACLIRGAAPLSNCTVTDITDTFKGFLRDTYEVNTTSSVKYYRHASFHDIPITPDNRQDPEIVVASISSDYFRQEQFDDVAASITDYRGPNISATVKTNNAVCRCPGWGGVDYGKIVEMSLREHSEDCAKRHVMVTDVDQFKLSSVFNGRKDYDKFVVAPDKELGFIICPAATVECTGYVDSRRCSCCTGLGRSLAAINFQAKKRVEIHSGMHITVNTMKRMDDDEKVEAVKTIRGGSYQKLQNERRRNETLVGKLEKLKTSQSTSHPDDTDVLSRIVESALPIAEQQFGKDSVRYHVFAATLEELQGKRRDDKGHVSKGVRYSPEVISYSLTLLRDSDEKTYNTFRDILYLPHRRYAQQKLAEEVGLDGDGVCWKMLHKQVKHWSNWAANNPEQSEGWTDVVVSYDSMEIAAGMMLLTKKDGLNRISGVILPDSQDVARQLFDKFMLEIKKDRGLHDDSEELEYVNEALIQNTQHSVYYVTSLCPSCKMSFIGAVFNTPTLNMGLISDHLEDINMALAENGFSSLAEASDCAGANVGYTNRMSTIPAKDFIPSDVLAKHGLDGEFLVAYEQIVGGESTFQLDDPPHVLKRVANACRNRKLSWDCGTAVVHPMHINALKDCYSASLGYCDSRTLVKHRNLKPELFDPADRAQKMKVLPAARLFSNTMAKVIDTVCSDATIALGSNSFATRKDLYSRARQLVSNMNEFFDLCNSKKLDQLNPNERYKVTPENAVETADSFLRILAWFQEWKDSLTDPVTGVFHSDHFVPDETYTSMQRCCYGFAALIYDVVIKRNRSIYLFRINQDLCEHHFSNVRVGCGHCRHPNQAHANACALTSHLKRSIKCSKYSNVTVY
jgi:hypothetical protein